MKALDLFAGTGWGVACQRLGIEEMGVEIMPEAIATREANGMETIYHDVWEGLEDDIQTPAYDILIASPPCQTFSLAGKGAGRKALEDVLEAIELHAYKDPTQLREFGEKHDDRTALVLTPLAHVWRDRPQYVAFEQVPTVLPVWEACAEVMREMGYSVWVGNLQAEQYGVPQTRKRAILMARLDGEVQPPVPTHSRYYSRDPKRMDPGVLPWVSMAEALGWDADVVAEKRMGRGMVERHGDRPGRPATAPAFAIRASAGGTEPGGFVLRSNYGTGGDASRRGERAANQPAPTLTSKADRNKWDGVRKLNIEEAAALQSYPVYRNGNQVNAAKRPLGTPAPTIHFGQRSNKVEWMDPELADDPTASGRRVTVEEASALQSYPADWTICHGVQKNSARRPLTEPAATIAFGHDAASVGFAPAEIGDHLEMRAAKRDGRFQPATIKEVSTLQSYPAEPPFKWCGTKGKQFLQIGNAVPPLLAQAVLEALVAE